MQRPLSSVEIWDDDEYYASTATLSDNAREAMELSAIRLNAQLDNDRKSLSSSDDFDNMMLSISQISLRASNMESIGGNSATIDDHTSAKRPRSLRSDAGTSTSEHRSENLKRPILHKSHNIRNPLNGWNGQKGHISASEPAGVQTGQVRDRYAKNKPRQNPGASSVGLKEAGSGHLTSENMPSSMPSIIVDDATHHSTHQSNREKAAKFGLRDVFRRRNKSKANNNDDSIDDDEIVEAPVGAADNENAGLESEDDFDDIRFNISSKGSSPWSGGGVRKKGKDSYFRDGKRLIDLVLPYQPKITSKLPADVAKEATHRTYRQRFQESLKALGLQLEEENLSSSQDGKTCFVKIHATWNFLARTAELQQLQMPFFTENQLKHRLAQLRLYVASDGKRTMLMDENIEMENVMIHDQDSRTDKILMALNSGKHPFRIEPVDMSDIKFKQISRFDRNRLEMFDDASEKERDHFFTDSQRSRLVYETLQRTTVAKQADNRLSKKETSHAQEIKERVSFHQLIEDDAFKNPMVLHDSECIAQEGNNPFHDVPPKFLPGRMWLYNCWGSFSYPWRKFQPLDEVWHYFGVKTSLYFAWLGFYTKYLYLPSLAGLCCLPYGIYSIITDPITDQYCNPNGLWSNKTTCRLCPSVTCPYDLVGNSCVYAKLTRLFDNEATVVYALFIALWAVIFLEKWKGRQAFLVEHWQAQKDFDDEVDRAQFQQKAELDTQRRRRKWHNAAVKYNEKSIEDPDKHPPQNDPWLRRQQRLVDPVTGGDNIWPSHQRSHVTTSLLTVIFFLTIVIGFMAGIVVYRMVAAAMFQSLHNSFIDMIGPSLFSSISGSVGNAVVILISTMIYTKAAWKLTVFEMHRTDEQFETSYTYKIFIFQFFNYFGSILYLALLKGKFSSSSPFYHTGLMVDACPYSGCMPQVCIQIMIIMSGKQIINNIVEVTSPKIKNYMRERKINKVDDKDNPFSQWEKDFELNEVTMPYHFADYLELVIQYGFLVMFAPAFPPAAILALLNNILEIRIDANKLLTDFRRPIPEQGDTIGAWFPILEILTKLAVVTNAFVIAFTSEFMDRISHAVFGNGGGTDGYLSEIFSTFNTSDYTMANDTEHADDLRFNHLTNSTVEICVYRGYYHNCETATPYAQSDLYYQSFLLKLVFVLVFEHLIFMVQSLLQAVIPDIPDDVETRLRLSQNNERHSIHFLDAKGGNEAFTSLRQQVAQMAARKNQSASMLARKDDSKPKKNKSAVTKAARKLRSLKKSKKARSSLDTVVEVDEEDDLHPIDVTFTSRHGTSEQQSHEKRTVSGSSSRPSARKRSTVSDISRKDKQINRTERLSEKKSRLTTDLTDADSEHDLGDYDPSLRSVTTANEVTMNDIRTTKQKVEFELKSFDRHPISQAWSWI